MLSDFLGFAGALGIQVIVSSIQNDTISDSYKFSCKWENEYLSENITIRQPVSETFEVADTLTVVQFIHHQSVAAVIILLASLSQGEFSQVGSLSYQRRHLDDTSNYSFQVMF